MNSESDKIKSLKNEYDYSNAVIEKNNLLFLVQYLDGLNKQLVKLTEEDEENNKKFKNEYREYNYKKSYKQGLNIYVRFANYTQNITCNDYEKFSSSVSNGLVKNIESMDIELDLSFFRGHGEDLSEHENSFKITIKPYKIEFIRISNYDDELIDQIENQINNIMNKFSKINSIFCSKE